MKNHTQLHSTANNSKQVLLGLLLMVSIFFLAGCGVSNLKTDITNDTKNAVIDDTVSEKEPVDYAAFDTPDRTVETHSNDVEPNFDEVFDDNTVKRLDIVIPQEQRDAMIADMTDLYGEMGTSQGTTQQGIAGEAAQAGNPGGLGDADERPVREEGEDLGERPTQEEVPVGGQEIGAQRPVRGAGGPGAGGPGGLQGGIGGGGGGDTFADEDPIYVPADIYYNDTQRYKVGVRFKGNSSLKSTRSQGNYKLSFKLNFDKYEDDYPWIENQRFYGIDKLSLKNNYLDPSMMREKVASDLFVGAGLVAPHTAFYEVYVDHGDGPTYFGVYTLVEEVDDTVIDTQFADDSGNLYKPDGNAATFAAGSYNEDQYVKKTNEDEADFTDVQALLDIINDEKRNTDPATRRADLEEVFDTDVFLKYLAVNTVIQNRDTYGRMTHNYFLYNDPDTDKLTWIPWDNNESLQVGKRGGSLALDMSNLSTGGERPLIEYLYADPSYKSIYDGYVQDFVSEQFTIERMIDVYTTYADLLEPYATSEIASHTFLSSPAAFQQSVDGLIEHVSTQNQAENAYLAE